VSKEFIVNHAANEPTLQEFSTPEKEEQGAKAHSQQQETQ